MGGVMTKASYPFKSVYLKVKAGRARNLNFYTERARNLNKLKEAGIQKIKLHFLHAKF